MLPLTLAIRSVGPVTALGIGPSRVSTKLIHIVRTRLLTSKPHRSLLMVSHRDRCPPATGRYPGMTCRSLPIAAAPEDRRHSPPRQGEQWTQSLPSNVGGPAWAGA